jgi:hypothetical protein
LADTAQPLPDAKSCRVTGPGWTAVLNPEKRNVGGSTPPLTTIGPACHWRRTVPDESMSRSRQQVADNQRGGCG